MIGAAFVQLAFIFRDTTVPDALVFIAAGVMVIIGAVGVVSSTNPVHAALMLVLTLFGVAVLFVLQGANFLAAVQVIVYAGAIVVLFLFVIMFLGVDRNEELRDPFRLQWPAAFALVALVLLGLGLLVVGAKWPVGPHSVAGCVNAQDCVPPAKAPGPGGDTAALGRSVFTTYLFPFEVTAALLVIAVVGAVALARRPHRTAEDDEADAFAAESADEDDADEPTVTELDEAPETEESRS